MKKTHLIIVNIILLLWYFLSMIGLKIGDKYLVTGVFEEEWLFMLIPTITFVSYKKCWKEYTFDMVGRVVCHSVLKS